MYSKFKVLFFVLALTLLLIACGAPAATEPASPIGEEAGVSGDLIIYSGRTEALIQPVIDAFKAKHPEVNVLLKAGRTVNWRMP